MIKIPYGRQFIDNKDILEVSKVLKGKLITTGNKTKELDVNKCLNLFKANIVRYVIVEHQLYY